MNKTMSDTLSPFGFIDVSAPQKVGLVKDVFARVASKYDLMNDVMSFGLHHLWKDAACAKLNPQPGDFILDCAGGTGDIGRRLAKLARAAKRRREAAGFGPLASAEIRVLDYNEAMITEGMSKGSEPEMSWAVGDAMALPLSDKCLDAYIISFGIRNVADIKAALIEAKRVLKPGGRFFCLEFSQPQAAVIRNIYDGYAFKIIPSMGELIARDRASYQYLVESIKRFPNQKQFLAMMRTAGFSGSDYTNYSGGVCALHYGWA
jgi:demethylmenaquinone methyltransferase / 2-methoxy-6-polyprenyl-1,4-benzoquinol methylase